MAESLLESSTTSEDKLIKITLEAFTNSNSTFTPIIDVSFALIFVLILSLTLAVAAANLIAKYLEKDF